MSRPAIRRLVLAVAVAMSSVTLSGLVPAEAGRPSGVCGGDVSLIEKLECEGGGVGPPPWPETTTTTTTTTTPAPSVPPGQTLGPPGKGSDVAVRPVAALADPVNSATGALYTSATDARFAAVGVGFALERHYNSNDGMSGPLGPGWTHDYAASLLLDNPAAGHVTLRAGDGQRVHWAPVAGGFVGDPGVTATLVRAGDGTYTITTLAQRRYRFDATGRLSAVVERNDQGLSLSYDANGYLAQVAGSGRVATFTHQGGRLVQVDFPAGRRVTYGYEGGRLATVRDAGGHTTTYRYDAGGRLSEVIDPNGHRALRSTYDPATGRVSDQLDARGKLTTFSWSAATETITMVDPGGGRWEVSHANRVLSDIVDPMGHHSAYDFDTRLRLASFVDARGNRTTFDYDGDAYNVVALSAPGRGTRRFAYNAANDLTSASDARGTTTTLSYSAVGSNLVAVARPDPTGGAPLVTSLGYSADGRGLVETVGDPRGAVTRYGHHPSGDLASITSPLGHRSTFAYDAAGRLASVTDPAGNAPGADPAAWTWALAYDAGDRAGAVVDPLGHTTSATYDPAGNQVTGTDASGATTTYGYDLANHLVRVAGPDPAVGPTTYTWDPAANLSGVTDGSGRSTTYTHHPNGWLKTATTALGTRSFAYDANANRTRVTDEDGAVTAFSYDAADRLGRIDYPAGTADVAFSYDDAGTRRRMVDGSATTTYTPDALGRITSVTRAGDTFTYAWDRASRLVSLGYPDGGAFALSYDDDGHLATLASGGTTLATYARDPAGRLVSVTRANGVTTTRAHDRAGRLVEVGDAKGAAVVAKATYVLDAVANPVRVTDAAGRPTVHEYDAGHRLVRTCYGPTCAGAPDWVAHTYDGADNRLSLTTPAGTTRYDLDATSAQLRSEVGPAGAVAYAYDRLGNLVLAGTTAYTWDRAGVVASVTAGGLTTTYDHDGDRRRVRSTTVASVINLVPEPLSGDLAMERDGAGATLRRYAYGEGRVAVEAREGLGWFHPDALGSTAAITDAAGDVSRSYAWAPYGAARSEAAAPGAAPNAFGWAGAPREERSADVLAACGRYSPATGRHHGPLAPEDAPGAPPYALAGANPLRTGPPPAIRPPTPAVASSAKGTEPAGPVFAAMASNAGATGGSGFGGGGAQVDLSSMGAAQPGVEGILKNPNGLQGKNPDDVLTELGQLPKEWKQGTLERGSRAGQGWTLREIGSNGEPTGRLIRYHPGGGRHGPNPYWRVSSGPGGKSGIIPGRPCP